MTVQIYAHRGSSSHYAEHTRAAYLQALADGADGVECDLRLSADGALVLLHDEDVDRTSNGTGKVAELTLAQLRALDFSSWHGAEIPSAFGTVATQLLTLPELLTILAGAGRPVGLALEFKYGATFNPELIDATLQALRLHGWDQKSSNAGFINVSFMSFHPDAMTYLARQVSAGQLCQLLEEVDVEDVREELEVGPIVGHTMAFFIRRTMAEAEKLVDDGVAQLAGPGVEYLRANPENAARWLAAGRTLRVWTVDSAEDLQLCLDAHVAQVTSNRPAEIRALLENYPARQNTQLDLDAM
ncbi:glycerophosphodiester phosphodiesterase [Arthrobacter glacialis]|uniref:Glycerophosphodiester phosphodiesterase n=1 Tax=Arthrobacter glacialis TaxID=1664 RepID=A0A2S3ZYG5_ARTGL|nr:glycerophosphodiester phosphodiesterase family protein [Arthrobacter glacialis]POH59287.1 glycerophosphodiester phosphodiesterase [Arthrobacter glacialis]POH73947.1 glycerophosphodiester phosphodiesterase [Arthrobacter glacialis]